MKDKINDIILKYYPEGISNNEESYYQSIEHLRLIKKIEMKESRWGLFYDSLVNRFNQEYVRDVSNRLPSNKCIVYIYKETHLFEITIYISKLAELYFFVCKKILVDEVNVATTQVDHKTNQFFPEIQTEGKFILNNLDTYFNYSLASIEFCETPVPNICTNNYYFGKVTLFNVLFSDSE